MFGGSTKLNIRNISTRLSNHLNRNKLFKPIAIKKYGNLILQDTRKRMFEQLENIKDTIKVDTSNFEKTVKKEMSECYPSGFGQ